MSVFYLNEVLKIMDASKPLRDTLVGVAKQTGCAAAGTAAGGLLMGPLGALVLGIAGAWISSLPFDACLTEKKLL
ncbi:hypothetical protein OESDEN_15426 [Oesophagostomum dentatum]|uniref:Uncharacterized protein n=1 Tax=Oesophagostomum dentatum TaxID=61180 RepID=A0A0B1SNR7_OESDE|nr:hypothetical protein OESDEN_15426 [Oesophagostomum dentatum]